MRRRREREKGEEEERGRREREKREGEERGRREREKREGEGGSGVSGIFLSPLAI